MTTTESATSTRRPAPRRRGVGSTRGDLLHVLGTSQQLAVEGKLQTRQWDDDLGRRHWKTEVVASAFEMLTGREKGAMHEAVAIAPDLPASATS
jgi:Single-strand binding protein family